MPNDYFVERDFVNQERLNEVIYNDLPEFCKEFFVGIQNRTTLLTRLNYAYDLRLFFEFLNERIPNFKSVPPKKFTLRNLDNVTSFDIEQFLNYIAYYVKIQDGIKTEFSNSERGKARKLSSVRALFRYFFRKEKLKSNVAANVDTPKIHDKEIIRLQNEEIPSLIDTVESGNGLTKHQAAYHAINKLRDTAIVTLLLGTGIRISECVGLNLDDIDFANKSFVVTRKGGNRVILFFSEEVADTLKAYFDSRTKDKTIPLNERALFVSKTKTRISVRSVELMVKKYSKLVAPLKNITPHKLRSTYGTELYRETGDIYIVADVLGHRDVNTTKRHYAAITENIRKNASDKVTLRHKDRTKDNEDD
ncbi:MAG: tyrosine-type recombinase/integrase [Clostridia bacterium]|nr:tyrosine-type recombinase/integrase [Clostridia bacterium]